MRKGRRFEKVKRGIKETVREAIEPTVLELGYRIWDVTYQKIGADFHLEITIDSDNGINIEDCERVHRAIDPILDEADPIEGFYYLEVSSPGIERELRSDEHIMRCIGERVEAKLFAPVDGRRAIIGELSEYSDGKVTLTEGDAKITLDRKDISRLTTVFSFDGEDL